MQTMPKSELKVDRFGGRNAEFKLVQLAADPLLDRSALGGLFWVDVVSSRQRTLSSFATRKAANLRGIRTARPARI